MRCPSCNSLDTQVKDSRPTEDSAVIRRRRVCMACNFRFTTFERVQLRELTVIKRNGRRVPFDRDKLVRSLQISLRKRPVDPEGVEKMVSAIVPELAVDPDDHSTVAIPAPALLPERQIVLVKHREREYSEAVVAFAGNQLDQNAVAESVSRARRHSAPASMDQARSGRRSGLAAMPPRSRYSSVKLGARYESPHPARSESGCSGAGFHCAVIAGLSPDCLPTSSRRTAGCFSGAASRDSSNHTSSECSVPLLVYSSVCSQ